MGGQFVLEAQAVDRRGESVAEVEIVWSVEDDGVIEHLGGGFFGSLANGSTAVTATTVEFPEIRQSVAVTVAQTAATLSIAGGDGQSAAVESAVSESLDVVVTDESGVPVPGIEVTFAVTRGGGALAGSTTVAWAHS